MPYRTFRETGWSISAIRMGCWAIGGNMGVPTDGADSLDTADAWGLGQPPPRDRLAPPAFCWPAYPRRRRSTT